MPNTFEYVTWLAMECLDLLESKRSVSQFFNTDYNKEFKQKFAVGDSVQVPFPQQFTVRNGLSYNPQTINRRHATISFDEPFGIDFEWDSAEVYLRAPRGRDKVSKEILEPAMSQLAQEIDSRCAQYAYANAASVVGVLGTDPTTYDATSAAARQKMQELECPDSGDRGLIVPPSVMRSVKTTAIGCSIPFRTSPSSSGRALSGRRTASTGTNRCRSTATRRAPGRARSRSRRRRRAPRPSRRWR
jgi:hypothetical protein